MYTKLEISHFKAFSSLKVAPLSRINLIAGDNNVGKTGILEAIYLAHADSYERLRELPSLFRRTQDQDRTQDRSQDVTDNFWLWLFHKRDVEGTWQITLRGDQRSVYVAGRLRGQGDNGPVDFTPGALASKALLEVAQGLLGFEPNRATYRLEGGLQPYIGGSPKSQPTITAVSTRFGPPSADAELVNTIAVRNEEDELIDCLRLVEPRLTKLKYLKLLGHKFPYVYADIGFGRGKELIPATQLGQGFARLLSLFATIMVNKTQILLIDEFENGLQHDALVPIWKALQQLARNRDIQIFATTHSYECIQAAHEAASVIPDYDLSVIRLQPSRTKEVEAMVLDREAIETALDAHLEVR